MKMSTFAAALVCCLCFGFVASTADEVKPDPKFKDAPVTDVLKWAQDALGCGFVYDAAELNGEDGKPRRVTSETTAPKDDRSRRLLLFEVLRRCDLVAFEVEGLPGPTYQLVRGQDAARYAPFVEDERDLNKHYFAAVAIKAARTDIAKLAGEVRRVLSPQSGHVEIFEPTHTLIVSDFADRLVAALAVGRAADNAAVRDEDLVLQDFAPRNGQVKRYAQAMERLRAEGESWKMTLHETSNTLLISGRRDELSRVHQRLQKLDANAADPAYAEGTYTARLVYITADDAAKVLREMFTTELAAYSVQIGAYEKTRSVIFRGSKADFDRANATLKLIDIDPEKRK
ncbi:MAG: hypothetical protein IT462_10565 [Planctomycetes bacterium]|nr:hypothetical protein [Planctomycetota bacterium]